MVFFKRFVEAIFMTILGYTGIFTLILIGVNFGPWTFTKAGLTGIFLLAMAYTFYFRL